MSADANRSPQTRRHSMQQRILRLPLVSAKEKPLGFKKALSIFSLLERTNSKMVERVEGHYEEVVDETISELEPVPDTKDTYVIRKEQLTAIIARSAIVATAQVATDVGRELHEVAQLQDLFTDGLESAVAENPKGRPQQSGDVA